jgi:uncharacterized membrane protein
VGQTTLESSVLTSDKKIDNIHAFLKGLSQIGLYTNIIIDLWIFVNLINFSPY